jgi:hypothetical protein
MDPASSVAAELWRPPHHHLASAAGRPPHLEVSSSAVTAAARSGSGGGSSSRKRPRRDAVAPLSEEEPSKLVSTSCTAASSSAAGGQDSVRLPPFLPRRIDCDLCCVGGPGVLRFEPGRLQLQRREIVACAARRRDLLDRAVEFYSRFCSAVAGRG